MRRCDDLIRVRADASGRHGDVPARLYKWPGPILLLPL